MELQNLPQPTRPLSFSRLTSFKCSSTIIQPPELIIIQDSKPSISTFNQQQQNRDEDEVIEELTRILFECLDNVDNTQKGFLLCKIFSELEKDNQIEDFIVEKLKRTQVKVISEFIERYPKSLEGRTGEEGVKYDLQEMVTRGFSGDLMEGGASKDSIEEFSNKLERFKVKTLNIVGGVIKK